VASNTIFWQRRYGWGSNLFDNGGCFRDPLHEYFYQQEKNLENIRSIQHQMDAAMNTEL
jgi:hypothetical protein